MKGIRFFRGFTLLAVLFILILFSLVGVYLIKMGAANQQAVNYSHLKAQANSAAVSAIELAQSHWLRQPRACPLWTFHFDNHADALAGYDVDITCPTLYAFPKVSPLYYAVQLKAVAKKGKFGEKGYVSQTVERWLIIDRAGT